METFKRQERRSPFSYNFFNTEFLCWTAMAQLVWRLATGWMVWGSNPGGGVQAGPGTHPAFYTMGTEPFLVENRPGRGVNHPPRG
jgi:hypothetical protein